MVGSLSVFHILYIANLAFLLVIALLIRESWQPINDFLNNAAGTRLQWMTIVSSMVLFFLLIGLFRVAHDVIRMPPKRTFFGERFTDMGLVVALIISNACLLPIFWRVSIVGYVPLVSRVSRALLRAETDYALPELLRLSDGTEVVDAAMWTEKRRPEILGLFTDEVYGGVPACEIEQRASLESIDKNALNGKAIRKEVVLNFENGGKHLDVNVLIYLPNKGRGPFPAFLGLNFYGNHTVHSDPNIRLSRMSGDGTDDKPRGFRQSRWQIERTLERGYALITAWYNEIDPDYDDGFQNGIHPLFYRPEQDRPAPNEWGSIAAWAWGLSRIMDYIETDDDIDNSRVAVTGHSRLGKTALWAGAQDERFAMVISLQSGCMGAAISRRKYGETTGDIISTYPHWFCGNFKKYAGREEKLPVDQHMLIALIAPRPVYIASADFDTWADPEGEFLSAKEATQVYALFGKDGVAAAEQMELQKPIMGAIGYHIRKGAHEVTAFDWQRFLDFADIHLRNT